LDRKPQRAQRALCVTQPRFEGSAPNLCRDRGGGGGSGGEHGISAPLSTVGPSPPKCCPPTDRHGLEVGGVRVEPCTPNPPWIGVVWGPTDRAVEPHGDDDPTRETPSLSQCAGCRLVVGEHTGVGLSYGASRTIVQGSQQHLLPNQQNKTHITTNLQHGQEADLGVGCDYLLLFVASYAWCSFSPHPISGEVLSWKNKSDSSSATTTQMG